MALREFVKSTAGKVILTITAGGAAGVATHEGYRNYVYRDPVGIPTVCYGHTGRHLQPGKRYTAEECMNILKEDLKVAENAVNGMVKVPISQQEFDAYVSFVYNVGAGNFQSSTLLRKLNAGDRVGACNELLRWVFARGQRLPGLVNRRQDENKVCLQGVYSQQLPQQSSLSQPSSGLPGGYPPQSGIRERQSFLSSPLLSQLGLSKNWLLG